ncbi:MAG: TIGR02206 family membrane protein [Woeseia sp.]
MQRYFDYHYAGTPFELFGPGHLAAVGILAAIIIFLFASKHDLGEAARQRARRSLIAAFLFVEVAYLVWLVTSDAWNFREHLPLHLCSFSIWGSVYVLATRSYRAYEIVFFLGIVGASQAILTPSAGQYGLPHFRAFQTLSSHSLVVIAMVYMTAIEGFRPTWRSVWKAMLAINLLALLVTGMNLLLGSNYMYTLHKPATASLFDHMGPWPWYLVYTEFLALALFSLLYLPFMLTRSRRPSPAE